MAINAKTQEQINRELINESNNLIVIQARIERYADKVDGANDTALGTLGYDAGEITQLRNTATAYHAIAAEIETNIAALEAIADTHLF